MRVLITGATGHVGSFVARGLVATGHDVYALVRTASNCWRINDILSNVTLLYGSMDDIEQIAYPIRQLAPEAVVHCAWSGVTADQRQDDTQITVNVVGSVRLCELALSTGCKHWVGLGSQAEYGAYDQPLSETMSCRPQSAYGVGKFCTGLLSERLCASFGARFAWLRLLATYGPRDDPRRLISNLINQLLIGRQPPLTQGTQRWDYLYVTDAADAVSALLATPSATGYYNLASGKAFAIRQIIETIRDLIDPELKLVFGEKPYSTGQSMCLEADISRIVRDLKWEPKVDLISGLSRTIAWHREHK